MVAYATVSEYVARTGEPMPTVTTTIDGWLEAASRFIELQMRLAPDYFSPTDGQTLYFDCRGGDTLYLRDGEGLAYCLRDVVADGIRADYDFTGAYDNTRYAWDLDDLFVWPIPRNHEATGRPIVGIELRRIGTAPVTVWPYEGGSVRIEGDWGWAAVPAAVRELTVHVARDMSDSESAGAAGRVQMFDNGIALRDDSWRMWQNVQRVYGRKLVGVPL